MAAYDVEDICGSPDGEMDTIERITNLDELFVQAVSWRQTEPDESDAYFTPNPSSGYQFFTGFNFTQTEHDGSDVHGAPHPSSGYRQSPISNFNSPASFMTASSPATFSSARSTYNSPAYMSARGYSPAMMIETIREDEPPASGLSAPLVQLHNEYYTSLHQQEIIQPFDKELNWSGKGQHVTFASHDAIPLSSISHLGSSMSATIDKVLCRRIALARKTMRCNRKWTVADALREVYHLQNLRHFHIVQLVGTYLQGRNFSILMYPVADMHLGKFLEDTNDAAMDGRASTERREFLASTLGCLASATAFIHERTTKHMDIKPQNILVRDVELAAYESESRWRIYLADFGLSRSFASQDHSQTDGPTSRTPRYCSPEVYNDEPRGRPADIFSLGCVFFEILCVICGRDLQDFADERRGDGDDESFHANLDRAVAWASTYLHSLSLTWLGKKSRFFEFEEIVKMVTSMVSREPKKRPTAADVRSHLASLPRTAFSLHYCCSRPPEQYTTYRSRDTRYPCN